MMLDLKRIIEGKRRLRRQLAVRPIGLKLSMLDALRQRAVLLRDAGRSHAVLEAPGDYGQSPPPGNSEKPREA